jgi:hypothetical protein
MPISAQSSTSLSWKKPVTAPGGPTTYTRSAGLVDVTPKAGPNRQATVRAPLGPSAPTRNDVDLSVGRSVREGWWPEGRIVTGVALVAVGRLDDARSGGLSDVAMMQATDFGNLNDAAEGRWLAWPSVGCILVRTRAPISALIGGRPTRGRPESSVQCSRKRRRCHRRTVSGVTIRRDCRHPAQTLASQTQKRRSVRRSLGRVVVLLYTASCWRGARFSRASWWWSPQRNGTRRSRWSSVVIIGTRFSLDQRRQINHLSAGRSSGEGQLTQRRRLGLLPARALTGPAGSPMVRLDIPVPGGVELLLDVPSQELTDACCAGQLGLPRR